MFKQTKNWIRNGLSIGHLKSVMREKRLSADLEQQEFIRGKRTLNNLPDSWNTQWIRRPEKSWKEKSKNRHQYDKISHTLSEKVHGLNFALRNKFEEEEFLFLLKTKFKNNWYHFQYRFDENGKIDLKDLYSISFENDWYEVAERLIKNNKLEAMYYTHTWDFDNFGVIERRSKDFIIAVKLP